MKNVASLCSPGMSAFHAFYPTFIPMISVRRANERGRRTLSLQAGAQNYTL